MGRKKASMADPILTGVPPIDGSTPPDGEQPAETPTEDGKVNKMQAVRDFLATAPDASPADIVAALAKNDVEITAGTAGAYKSKIKTAGGEPRTRQRSAPVVVAGPTLDHLFKVRGWLDKSGESFEVTHKLVQSVAALAQEVSGLDNLTKCLDALEKLSK